jgi:hypothetical protein
MNRERDIDRDGNMDDIDIDMNMFIFAGQFLGLGYRTCSDLGFVQNRTISTVNIEIVTNPISE